MVDIKLPEVGKIIDDVFTSQDEANASINERLISDNSSGSWIPKAIRPILSIIYTALFVFVFVYGLIKGLLPYAEALAAITAIVLGIIGFYFTGRNKLKIAEIQSKAAIRITELKTRHELKQEKKDNRLKRKAEKELLKDKK